MVTCEHVVAQTAAAELGVSFEGDAGRRSVAQVSCDAGADVAILKLAEPVTDREPLQFSRSCLEGSDFTCYGFPKRARWNGVPFSGRVERVNGIKDGLPRLQLFSDKVAAGMGTPIHGLSGSPVLVGLHVVGHVSEMLAGEDGRPVFGLVYAVAASQILPQLGDSVTAVEQPSRPEPLPINLAERSGATREKAAIAQLQSAGAGTSPEDALRAAEALIALGEPRAALRSLDAAAPGVRTTQLTALALARTGKLSESTQLLEELYRRGQLDAETAGLLGGRYKQAGLAHGDRAELLQALAIYRAAYQRTRDPYPGINVAAVALYLDDDKHRAEAQAVAREVAAEVEARMQRHPEDVDHWRLATLAEALLIQGRLDEAKSAYERAVGAAPRRPQDIAVMRRQARSNLQHLGKNAHLLDDVLPVPGVAAFTGHMTDAAGRRPPRFPEARVGAVRESIRSALRARNVRYGVCSAARGSDLIFLDELLRRDGSAKVFLPFPSDAFKRSSVGGSWNRIFDQLLAAPGVELSVLMAEAPAEAEQAEAFAECNREIEKLALEQAKRLDQRPLLLAVWNGDDDGKLGGTGDFVNGWRDDAERDVQIIKPF
jgi:tetratricopeptide (TPR) repeat protein